MEFNSALPFPKVRPLKACLNHFPIPVISRSPWRAFRQIHNFGIIQGFFHSMRLGCRAALWPAPGRRQTPADSPSQRGSDPARQRCSNSTLPRRQGAKRENRIRSAPCAVRQRRRRRVFVVSRSIAFGEFDVGLSDRQRPGACTRRQPSPYSASSSLDVTVRVLRAMPKPTTMRAGISASSRSTPRDRSKPSNKGMAVTLPIAIPIAPPIATGRR